jgi:hypothetical protein
MVPRLLLLHIKTVCRAGAGRDTKGTVSRELCRLKFLSKYLCYIYCVCMYRMVPFGGGGQRNWVAFLVTFSLKEVLYS